MKKLLLLMLSLFGLSNVFTTQAADTLDTAGKKILIAYYSHSGNTKTVAQAIHRIVGGDLFEIKTKGSYPSDYNALVQQAKKEIAAGYRPELTSKLDNIDQYDIVFLGSPNWWGTITPQVSAFIATYPLKGKIVIPFITHGSGGLQNTLADITAQCKGATVWQNAWSGYGNNTKGLAEWLKKLGFVAP